MKESTFVIRDALGIHARPAGLLVKAAAPFQSRLTLEVNGKTADAKRIMAVMSMGAKKGMTLKITAEGEDEDEAIHAIEAFLEQNL